MTAGSDEPARTKIFVLDDHEIVRQGLVALLESGGDMTVVGQAASAREALIAIPSTRPDVAVLDGRLPDGSGIDVCRDIRSQFPEIRCLMLTSYDDDEALFAAVMAGASGYLLKEIQSGSLVEAVRAVARGESLLDPDITTQLRDRLQHRAETDTRLEALTAREREILDLITEGLSNREIASRMYLAEKTVKNYVSGLLSKLRMQRRTQAAVFRSGLDQREP